jgi:hypothetical protein
MQTGRAADAATAYARAVALDPKNANYASAEGEALTESAGGQVTPAALGAFHRALAADGSHLGGLIAPSPPLMRDALTGATARLSTPQAARVVERADNTGDAIESGVWLAAAALLERFAARATTTFGAAPSIVLTGGGAERLATLIEPVHRIDAEVVLRGLAIYASSPDR